MPHPSTGPRQSRTCGPTGWSAQADHGGGLGAGLQGALPDPLPQNERCARAGAGGRARDELKVVLDEDAAILLLEGRPAARGHAQPASREVEVLEHGSCRCGQHLYRPLEVITLPMELEHLVADIVEVEAAEGGRVRVGMVQLPERPAVLQYVLVVPVRLPLQNALGVHPPVPVPRVGTLEHASDNEPPVILLERLVAKLDPFEPLPLRLRRHRNTRATPHGRAQPTALPAVAASRSVPRSQASSDRHRMDQLQHAQGLTR
mmetsp:Transcript_17081/g.54495  ORF Transcript_17081/g.54495 Transcript_17081/m.54495 type:complete len:261 (+) Transcript_17081:878-1660(+)